MPPIDLTSEQRRAVGSSAHRLFIEAAPGAGKTTVAAERFAVRRFNVRASSTCGMTAVSFTRSATSELHSRISDRWGSTALAWPHAVLTIDALLCRVAEYLLRRQLITWPGDHVALEVLDDWHGHRGYRWLDVGSYRRVAAISSSGAVTSLGRRVVKPRLGIGSRSDFESHLGAGLCTHEEIRDVLKQAMATPHLRSDILKYVTSVIAHLVVDEVFDANDLDLDLVRLACEGGVAVTLIGDPWQALYGFRGARPELVPGILGECGFATLPLSHSFRFQTQGMRQLGQDLRAGRPISPLPAAEAYDVALASKWDDLWRGGDDILPLSFGHRTNKTDAAAILLLDHLVHSLFKHHAIFLPEALVLLALDHDTYRKDGARILGGVVEMLARHEGNAPANALSALRHAMKELGAARRPPAGSPESETRQIERLSALASRLRHRPRLVPGMTVHQAKGREWNRVGLLMSDGGPARLAAGLDQSNESDRVLYVALTRARHQVGVVQVGKVGTGG